MFPGVLDRLSDAARDAAEAIRLADLDAAMASVAAVVHSPQFVLCGFDAAGRFVLHAGNGELRATFADYVGGVYAIDPLQERLLQLSRFPPIANHAALGIDVVRFRRSEAYQDYFRRVAVDRMLVCTLTEHPYGAPGAMGMMFTRPADRDDFDESDAQAAAAILPAFASAVRRHERFAAIEHERDCLAAVASAAEGARLLFDAKGQLAWRSPLAAAWLAEVPADLARAAGRLADLAVGGSLAAGTPGRVPCVLPDGRAVTADLSVVRTATGDPLVEARLVPAGLGAALLGQAMRRFGLTRAEGEVLNALLRGETNPEAARRLFVSLETIRTHVHRVLSKLGVSSRHDVAAVVSRALKVPALAGASVEPG